ncbi:MAG: hypothetical protein CL930_02305 [Deltaproteobacteria bacterium]|nr:hypothetical protein [Deltaproteobacteria bacterium]|tara:strand:- start:711 stop:1538 length:828 start_codon:yes stop_codon:yes gene_type:complete
MSRRRRADKGPRVDLHCHTIHSDGLYAPEDVARMAAQAGLSALAITDHDLPPVLGSGVRNFGEHSIRLVAGVELSTMHENRELHLLVYFPGEMPADFAEWCRDRARWRASWYDESIDLLGLDIPKADAQARQGLRTLTRVHLARAVVAAGITSTLHQAFEQYVGGSADRIPELNMAFLDALSVAKDAGGWTAWAHPPPKQAEEWAASFAAAGLDALESYRPNKSARNRLSRLSHGLGMGISGGSDWHGWEKRKMGSFRIPAQVLHKTDVALNLHN